MPRYYNNYFIRLQILQDHTMLVTIQKHNKMPIEIRILSVQI